MKRAKTLTKKILILIVVAGLPASWIVFDNILNKIKIAENVRIATSNLKHKKDIMRLKAKHKKEITQLKLKHKKNIAKTKMKERGKRWFASIPVVGTVLLLWSGKEEYDDYEQWLNSNPDGTVEKYGAYKADLLVEP